MRKKGSTKLQLNTKQNITRTQHLNMICNCETVAVLHVRAYMWLQALHPLLAVCARASAELY